MKHESAELNHLLDSLLNETLTADQHARLQEILRSSEEARDEYLSYIDIHLGMKELEVNFEEELFPAGCCTPEVEIVPSRPSRRSYWKVATLGGVVAVALFVSALWSPISIRWRVGPDSIVETTGSNETNSTSPILKEEAEPPVVILTQASHAELLLEYVPAIGDPLKLDHEYVLLKGMLGLTFQNGATATLKSPSVFTVKSANLMEMKIGICSVHAPDEAKGFEVLTPQSRIVDLGTRFSVVANDTGTSDVQVLEGAVEVHPLEESGPHSMLLEGEAARFIDSSQQPEPIRFNRNQYQKQFPDRVISYEATEDSPGDGVEDLVSVTVQRGGQVLTYPVQELIGIDVIHFSSCSITNNAACIGPLPDRIVGLLSDDIALTSGLPNYNRGPEPYDHAERFENFRERYGMAIQFRQPVVNGPGPDAVVFEVQSAAYPASGDSFYVSPIEDQTGLKTHLVEKFDIMLNSVNARRVAPMSTITFESPVRSVEDFERVQVVRSSKLKMPFFALAVGIDFSDLGYPEGALVHGLFLEDADDDEHVVMDPVFIGGFPQ